MSGEAPKNLKGIFSETISRFAPSSSSISNSPKDVNPQPPKQSSDHIFPQDIPYDELMQLSMKMNKRMQAMEAKGQEMARRLKTLITDRRQIIEIMAEVTGTPMSNNEEEPIDFETWRSEFQRIEDAKFLRVKELEDEITKLKREVPNDTLPSTVSSEGKNVCKPVEEYEEFQSLLKSYHQLEIDYQRVKNIESSLRTSHMNLESQFKEKSNLIDSLTRQLETIQQTNEEKIIHLQIQLTSYKHKDELKDQEISNLKNQLETITSNNQILQINFDNSQTHIQEFKDTNLLLSQQLIKTKEKLKDVEKNSSASVLLKAEQEALLKSLRKDLKIALESKQELERKVEESASKYLDTEALQLKLSESVAAVSRLQVELEDATATITRLRAEAQTAEKNHAIRTAMLAAAESQIASLTQKIESIQKTDGQNAAREQALKDELKHVQADSEIKLADQKQQFLAEMQKVIVEKQELERVMVALKSEHSAAIDALNKDFAKKSATARTLITEKDEELDALRKRVDVLQQEIDSGSHNERRIFELAQMQANREASYGVYSDTRDIAFQQIQETLAARDLSLAQIQQSYSVLLQEATELRKIRKREGVNMDYLKNIVIQFMSFPAASPERWSLVPVVATLLQFSRDEIAAVENAMKAPLWSSRPVKEVKVCTPSPPSASATSRRNHLPEDSLHHFPPSPTSPDGVPSSTNVLLSKSLHDDLTESRDTVAGAGRQSDMLAGETKSDKTKSSSNHLNWNHEKEKFFTDSQAV